MSREELLKAMTLVLTTERWSFSISEMALANAPLWFSHWSLINMDLSHTLALICGRDLPWLSLEISSVNEVSSSLEWWDLFRSTADSMLFFATWSSRDRTFSWSCFRCLMASPRTEALSIFGIGKLEMDRDISYLALICTIKRISIRFSYLL